MPPASFTEATAKVLAAACMARLLGPATAEITTSGTIPKWNRALDLVDGLMPEDGKTLKTPESEDPYKEFLADIKGAFKERLAEGLESMMRSTEYMTAWMAGYVAAMEKYGVVVDDAEAWKGLSPTYSDLLKSKYTDMFMDGYDACPKPPPAKPAAPVAAAGAGSGTAPVKTQGKDPEPSVAAASSAPTAEAGAKQATETSTGPAAPKGDPGAPTAAAKAPEEAEPKVEEAAKK
jgi:hypothetical protein